MCVEAGIDVVVGTIVVSGISVCSDVESCVVVTSDVTGPVAGVDATLGTWVEVGAGVSCADAGTVAVGVELSGLVEPEFVLLLSVSVAIVLDCCCSGC